MRFEEMDEYSPIADYYAGKSVFVTGATGFLGMVLVEKLLYSCPDIGNIYILIREKKGVSPDERMKNYTQSIVFERLKTQKSYSLSKIRPIVGNLTDQNLGINNHDLEVLYEEVSVVFHLAATVRFIEPLSVAVKVNVEGSQKVLEICQKMKKIDVFVYMSTIFSNTDQERIVIHEELYPIPKQMNEVYRMIEENDPKDTSKPEALCGRGNTYTFSKALTENIIAQKHGDVPAVIIRPAIITPAYNEPAKGWMCNWMGPTPILTFLSKGWFRCFYAPGDNSFTLIPVDYVANLTIVAAARQNRSKEVSIYNLCTSGDNKLTLNTGKNLFLEESKKHNFSDLPWPWLIFTTSNFLYYTISLFLHTIPAYIADFFLFITGQQVRCVNMLKKLEMCASVVEYFASRDWVMKTTKTRALISTLSETDKRKFPFNPRDINWKEYMILYFHGVKKYLLNVKEK